MGLYRRPDCVIHEINVTVDPDRCVKCGAVNRWTILADIDYLAMIDELELRRADGDVPIHVQLNEDDLRAAIEVAAVGKEER